MAVATTTLLVASLAATAIGAGVSAYGSYQQGKSQEAIAAFNAANQQKQAQSQLIAMQTQAALQKQQAEANYKLRTAEAAARNNNADAIEKQVLQQDRVDRINSAKKLEEYRRMQAGQRASIAASGLTESSGTPLDILAETAAKIQASQEEDKFANEMARWSLLAEAGKERFGGKLAIAGATLDRDSGVLAAGLREVGARSEYLAGIRGAQITRLTGSAARTTANYQAAGSLLGGAADAFKMGAKL